MSQWVAIDAALELNHKVARFRAELGWNDNDLVARLYRLWAWVRRERLDGTLTRADLDAIPAVMDRVKLEGDVVTALLAHGLLRAQGNGTFEVPGWLERNGGFLKTAIRHQAKLEGARKGGQVRATGPRDATGRYLPTPSFVQPSSSLPPPFLQLDQPEHEHEPKAEEMLRAQTSSGSEPASERRPVIELPTNVKGSMFRVSASDLEGWSTLYPAVDVPQQLRSMKGWLDAHPDRRKTQRGMRAFVNRWLSREQDRGPRPSGTGPAPASDDAGPPESSEARIERWRRQGILP